MTDNERIDKLEDRVTRLETSIEAKLNQIFEKLNTLTVEGVKNACPSPGACLQLSHELTHAVKYLEATTQRTERLELKILEMERTAVEDAKKTTETFHKIEVQKAWVLGAWSVIAFFAAIVGALITILINYYLRK